MWAGLQGRRLVVVSAHQESLGAPVHGDWLQAIRLWSAFATDWASITKHTASK
jgi:hypothetical protein